MAPRVLVSDKLSDAAVQIFATAASTWTLPDLGKDKEKLLEIIG
jgi:D-3-phosphoglycerate dehydrogenase